MTIRKAVFPVAGMGSRFLPATKATPKEMLPIVDKPLIQYAVEEAISIGVEQLIFVTSSTKRAIEDHFDTNLELEKTLEKKDKQALLSLIQNMLPKGVQCVYVRQSQPLGLGHAVWCAKNIVGDEPFAVLLADDLIDGGNRYCLEKMSDIFNQTHSSVIAVENIPSDRVNQYGIVEAKSGEHNLRVMENIIEKPAIGETTSTLAVVGRYILNPSIFSYLENTKPGASGEIQLTDAIAAQLNSESVYLHELTGIRYDCGSKLGYLQATIQYGLKHPDLGSKLRDYLQTLN